MVVQVVGFHSCSSLFDEFNFVVLDLFIIGIPFLRTCHVDGKALLHFAISGVDGFDEAIVLTRPILCSAIASPVSLYFGRWYSDLFFLSALFIVVFHVRFLLFPSLELFESFD